MAYRVVLRRSAARELPDLTQPIRGRLTRALGALSKNPRLPGAKLLSGLDRIWRLRVGDYRILYRVDDDVVRVVVIRIRHRSAAYR
jgi:mRNA interferase RelE/StbE